MGLFRGCYRQGSLKLEDDINLDALWPLRADAGPFNENPVVIRLKSPNLSILFTGDLNIRGEEGLLKENINPKADILKVGHHGYLDATSGKFLDAVSP